MVKPICTDRTTMFTFQPRPFLKGATTLSDAVIGKEDLPVSQWQAQAPVRAFPVLGRHLYTCFSAEMSIA